MKQYVYTPHEAGLEEWASGSLRLDGIEVTENPAQADLFVHPGPLHAYKSGAELERLPYFAGNESRHVFFHCSDDEVRYGKPCLFIRCNLRPWNFEADPNSIAWPWPVEDFAECVDAPSGGLKFDVSFQGWRSSDARTMSVESCRTSGLAADLATYLDFCGYIYDTPEGIRRRKEFRRSMKESRVALCPQSIPGVLPYRFFESLSAGRVAALVCSAYVLPFADEIPYNEFVIKCEADNASSVGSQIAEWLKGKSDEEILVRGLAARFWFEKLLTRDKWPALMAYAVEKKVQAVVAA